MISTLTVTLKEAAAILDLKESTVRQYVSRRLIGAYKPAKGKRGKLYFDIEELERYKRQNRIKSMQEIESEAATYNMRKAS